MSYNVSTGPVISNNRLGYSGHGDTYYTAWSKNGTLFMTTADTKGFNGAFNAPAPGNYKAGRNVTLYTLSGDGSVPGSLFAQAIYGQHNAMAFLGGESEFRQAAAWGSWKPTGLAIYDNVLYMTITNQNGGTDGVAQGQAGTILKSLDGGRNWQNSAPGFRTNSEIDLSEFGFRDPRFSRISFVQYDGPGGFVAGSPNDAENWVYAISNDGRWDGGNDLYLGRCARGRMAWNDPADWSFYKGMENNTPQWGSLAEMKPIMSDPGRLSQTMMYYNSTLRKYILPEWYYDRPAEITPGSPKYYGPESSGNTTWKFYVAENPWGLWQADAPIWTQEWKGDGFYNPTIPAKFVKGSQMTLLFAGNYWDEDRHSLHSMTVNIAPNSM